MLISARSLQAQVQPNLVINGIVQDQTGAAFPGAEVDLLRDGEQQRSTTTDASGTFRFDRLQPGNYEVRTHREGFKTDTTKLVIGTRPPARLRIVLSIETLSQQITVSGDTPEVSTDPSENRDVAAVDREALDDLPIFDQDIVATMSRFLDNSALGTNGVTLIIDGIQATSALSASAIQTVTDGFGKRLELTVGSRHFDSFCYCLAASGFGSRLKTPQRRDAGGVRARHGA